MKVSRRVAEYFVNWTRLKIKIHVSQESTCYFYEREMWWASLGANIGFEQDGKHQYYERPVLVLKKFNKDVLWILPLTSREKEGKYYFKIEHNGGKSFIILSQLRLISAKRLLRKIGIVSEDDFEKIRARVKELI